MTMKRKKLLGIAAATSVGVAVVATAGTVMAGDVSPTTSSGYCADMQDAIGVYAGNPITQMGYRVGKVDRVQPQGDHVEVTFSLDGGRKYPADVKAVTRSKSLLADRSLELVGNYRAGALLRPGNCIPLARSFTPKSISQIAGSAADFIDAMAPEKKAQSLQAAIGGLDNALRAQGGNANQLMQHASAAAVSPDELVSDIGSSILNMAPLTADGGSIQKIEDAMGRINTVMPSIPDVRNLATVVSGDLRDLSQHTGEIDRMLDGIGDTATVVNNRSDQLKLMFSDDSSHTGTYYWRRWSHSFVGYIAVVLPNIGSIFEGGLWMVPMLDSLADSGQTIRTSWDDGPAAAEKLSNFLRTTVLPFAQNPAVNVRSVQAANGDQLISDVQNVLRMLGAVK